MSHDQAVAYLIGTRWFGVLGPCRLLIRELVDANFRVVVYGQQDEHYRRYDEGLAELRSLRMRRSYFAPRDDLLDILTLCRAAWRERPLFVHSFNPKPALLSTLAAHASRDAAFFIGVTGLGNTFIRAPRLKRFVTLLLQLAARRASAIFFQNLEDMALFEQAHIGSPAKYRFFQGPGVDTEVFDINRRRSPVGTNLALTVVCVARLIWQKGIREYVTTARTVTTARPSIKFLLIGEFDLGHPDCVARGFIERAIDEGAIRHLPWTDALPDLLAEADVLVHHSYREGAPRAILEAAAMGVPTVGADAPGVRELVEHDVSGLLTPLHDVQAIVDAITRLDDDRGSLRAMGTQARLTVGVPLSLLNATAAQWQMYADHRPQ